MLEALNRLTSGRAVARMGGDKLNLFNKVYGSEALHQTLRRGAPVSRLISGWSSYTNSFRSARQRHLMYA